MTSLINQNQDASDRRYLLLRDNSHFDEQRNLIESLWIIFQPFADPEFQTEIAHQFHPRFWEMYLCCTMLDMGFNIKYKNGSHGPDLCLVDKDELIWIEATAPDAGIGNDAVPLFDEPLIVFSSPEEKIILRFTNSLYKKKNKFIEYISQGIISKNDPCLIAINGSAVPNARLETEIPYIVKAVLPFGDLALTIDIDKMEIIDEHYIYRDQIKKESGANVPTNSFLDNEFSIISGLIYSKADLWNMPSQLGEDFIFIHNPNAINPIKKFGLSKGLIYSVQNDRLISEEAPKCT